MSNTFWNRRRFLATAGGLMATGSVRMGWASDGPVVKTPRATDGDDRHEPSWKKQLTISVGPQKADLVGTSEKVLQAAVDYVTRFGGGTVKVLPGTYTLRNAVHLSSGVRLLGSGSDTLITRVPSVTTSLSEDSDWYDQEVTLSDARGFQVGDGVTFRAKGGDGESIVIKRTLVARSGKRFKLNDGLRKNLWLSGNSTCASLFPLLTSESTSDVTIENLVLDGNRTNCEFLDGNYAGCIFLQDCNCFSIRNVEARNYNGDGISFQVCHDVTVQDCFSHDHAGLGLHPGSGSQRPILRNNRLERNRIGLFWCWGVKFGLADGNRIDANTRYGISIGHNDTDNVMQDNVISNSGQVGILFRDESGGQNFWPNRNCLRRNRIIDSGDQNGVAIDVLGKTRDVVIASNVLQETRQPMSRIGIRIAATAGKVEIDANRIEGFANAVVDQRRT